MKCPICNTILTETIYKDEVWGTLVTTEIYQKCNNCNKYKSEYVYGDGAEFIGKYIIGKESIYKEKYNKKSKTILTRKIIILLAKVQYRLKSII